MQEEYEPTVWERIEPTLYGISLLVMNVGLVVAGLALAYLVYGLLSGSLAGYDALSHADRARILGNIALAGNVLKIGLIAAALGAGFGFRNEDSTGYALLGGAVVIGLGIPYAVRTFAGAQTNNAAASAAIASLVNAVYVPAIVGALLVVRDVIVRIVSAVRDKPVKQEEMTYGSGAQQEKLPVRTSLLAKCWEGGFCREFIRPHCPIFLQRKACWKERRGCYCEEDIVSNAAAKVQGIVLDMAPDPKYNFANTALPIGQTTAGATFRKPELSAAQKRERCRNCVIYNEHQSEKYKILLPAVVLGGLALCVIFAPLMRAAVGGSLTMVQSIFNRASFSVGGATQAVHPGATVEWVFVGAFTVMILSKLLQLVEWACFKAKI